MPETLHIYLLEPLRSKAAAGEINVFNKIEQALDGWTIRYHDDTDAERMSAAGRGYGLFHMREPTAPHILCLRRTYHYPFWRIEKTNERWNFDVARSSFEPSRIPADKATAFYQRWRPRIYGNGPTLRGGFVFIPLQGRLLEQRSFQSQSPVEMIETVLSRMPETQVRASLHPRETYTQGELAALDRLVTRHPRFQMVSAESKELLAECDLVVTQNSSVALTGYFAQKPAILFAGSDFHHIAGSVPRDGLEAALKDRPDPDFVAYLFWFFQWQSINAGSDRATEKLRARFASHGFPVG